MFEQIRRDRLPVKFSGAQAGIEPLTWGQKTTLRDMHDNGTQFSMSGRTDLAPGSRLDDAAARLSRVMSRHAVLRMRLTSDSAGRPCQEIAGSGQTDLDILTLPDDAEESDITRFLDELLDSWKLEPFDLERDWPLRMAVVRHRGTYQHLAWELGHLAVDGAGHMLLLAELMPGGFERHSGDPALQVVDVARSEQGEQLRQLSRRTMRYWESALGRIPALTFGQPAKPDVQAGPRYWRVEFDSPAAHLAMLAIAGRTGTDGSRVALAVIAIAIGRATGRSALTLNVTVSNRFRPGLADVMAPLAQSSVVSIDVADSTIDEVVVRARGSSLTAGMRAYYDPDDLAELTERLDAERGQARISCRVNDQRAMARRSGAVASAGGVTSEQISEKLAESKLTWLRPLEYDLYDQAMILIQDRPGVISLHMLCDLWSTSSAQVEKLLRGVEEIAVEAAFNPSARTMI
ncbi:MAG TPA: condensation domain-containing protein [Streptosporangiaceae bacterium]|nr:condensation domain-containing protein [Streptosporangiaceae bacterium]